MHHAAKEGQLEIVQFLLKNNANIDCEWGIQYKSTPLYLATEATHAEIVKTLLINGANANHRSAHLAAFVEAKNKMRVYFFEYAKDLNLNIKCEGYRDYSNPIFDIASVFLFTVVVSVLISKLIQLIDRKGLVS